jgi:hypothetical protein
MFSRQVTLTVLAALLSISAVQAAGFDQPIVSGKTHLFSGYLTLEVGYMPPPHHPPAPGNFVEPSIHVFLSRFPNGEVPAGFQGRTRISLNPVQPLLKEVRKYGAATRVMVQGRGIAGKGLWVEVVEQDREVFPAARSLRSRV